MEDLIRRSDAIKGAKRLHNLFSSPFYNRDRVEMIEAYFNAIPSADRPQGEWIDGKCSLCGKHAPYWAMATTYYKSNYCPSCGARMKGADNDNL